MAIDNAAW